MTDIQSAPSGARHRLERAPREISRLARPFFKLLDRLSAARRQVAESEHLGALGTICLSAAHELRDPLIAIKPGGCAARRCRSCCTRND